MTKLLKIGIVGCGAIGSSLARTIAKDFIGNYKLAGLYDIDSQKAKLLSRLICGSERLVAKDISSLIKSSDLVIEAASSRSSFEIAKVVLAKARDIMIMSVGGIVANYKELSVLANKFNAKIYLPSGAISGIDALKAANMGKIKKVTLTTRKSPLSFKGVKFVEEKGISLASLKKETVLFSGPAKQAVNLFPQNINVAAVLSIAGIGQEKTRVRIIACPGLKKNIHEIEIVSVAARISTRTENILHPDNPKTSYLAVLSAIAALKQILDPIKVGT